MLWIIGSWYREGGVLLMGYEMYRLLSSKRGHIPKPKRRRKKTFEPEVIDVEEEDRNKDMLTSLLKNLRLNIELFPTSNCRYSRSFIGSWT